MKRLPFYNLCAPVSAAISAAGNVLGAGIGAIAGYGQQKREQEFNAEQAEINRQYQTAERVAAQQFNIDMWNMNNEYNSPAAQKQRLMDAGYSPNALLGGGAPPVSASAPTTNPQSGSLAQTGSGLSSALVGAGSSLGKNTADIINSLADTENKKYDLYWNKKTEPQRLELMDSEVKKNFTQIETWLSQKGVNNATEYQLLELNKYIAPLKSREIKKIDAELNSIYLRYREQIANAKLTEQKIETEKENTELVGAQRAETSARAELAYEQSFQTKLENEFSLATGIPVHADAFQVAFAMWSQGEGTFSDYVNTFVIPQERATWKIEDWKYTDHDDTQRSFGSSITGSNGQSQGRGRGNGRVGFGASFNAGSTDTHNHYVRDPNTFGMYGDMGMFNPQSFSDHNNTRSYFSRTALPYVNDARKYRRWRTNFYTSGKSYRKYK